MRPRTELIGFHLFRRPLLPALNLCAQLCDENGIVIMGSFERYEMPFAENSVHVSEIQEITTKKPSQKKSAALLQYTLLFLCNITQALVMARF